MLAWAALLACAGGPEDSAAADSSAPPDEEYEGCEEVTIFHDGPDEPHVGDSWTVILKCDGAVLMGPMVITFDPTDFATLDENTVAFVQAGTGTMKVQVGAHWTEEEVTVLE